MTEKTQTEMLAQLREPFPDSEIRYLSRVWCRSCKDSKAGCQQHQMIRCEKCRSRITQGHIDLAYVGHAEATNRLLNVDPTWSWEPVAFDAQGLPQYDQNGGLWIRLTVCGVSRLGYGNAEGKRGGDAVKEIIGDAIRNAGMRFGMALDLWTSSDLEISTSGPAEEKQPPRDFVAEAMRCTSADCVVEVYQAAQSSGAGDELLGKIKAIGMQMRAVESSGEGSQDEHAAAEAALRAWAAENGITDLDADAYRALGAPLEDVGASAIWGLLKQLQSTA